MWMFFLLKLCLVSCNTDYIYSYYILYVKECQNLANCLYLQRLTLGVRDESLFEV